jgi:hypothetical protein
MEEVRDRVFSDGEEVETEGKMFINCTFGRASFRYGGGALPQFIECTFGESGWHFEGAALRTIQLLQATASAEGGEAFIAALFRPGFYIAE